MNIHVRLRDDQEADIIAWYESQGDKSRAVRDAIRNHLRLQDGDTQGDLVKEAVAGEVTQVTAELEQIQETMARLPDIVAAAVREALAGYQFSAARQGAEPGEEDPELAARLDEQLDVFFEDGDE